MMSLTLKLKSKEYPFIFLASFLVLGICQDRILISDISSDEDNPTITENSTIPESLLIQLGAVKNASDLFTRFISAQLPTPLHGPTMEDATERRALASATTITISEPANCRTEEHIVELEKPGNGNIIFWPSCVRVRRCGGCCTSSMLACKPTASSILNVTVLELFYNLNNLKPFESQGTRSFCLEQHDRCSCSCKQVAQDCNPDVQEYKPHECRCVCKNPEAAALCTRTGPKKVWDNRDCLCKCREVRPCSTGYFFNFTTCRCEVLRQSLPAQNMTQQNSTVTLSSQDGAFSP